VFSRWELHKEAFGSSTKGDNLNLKINKNILDFYNFENQLLRIVTENRRF
jgi:hypothetical protein